MPWRDIMFDPTYKELKPRSLDGPLKRSYIRLDPTYKELKHNPKKLSRIPPNIV